MTEAEIHSKESVYGDLDTTKEKYKVFHNVYLRSLLYGRIYNYPRTLFVGISTQPPNSFDSILKGVLDSRFEWERAIVYDESGDTFVLFEFQTAVLESVGVSIESEKLTREYEMFFTKYGFNPTRFAYVTNVISSFAMTRSSQELKKSQTETPISPDRLPVRPNADQLLFRNRIFSQVPEFSDVKDYLENGNNNVNSKISSIRHTKKEEEEVSQVEDCETWIVNEDDSD